MPFSARARGASTKSRAASAAPRAGKCGKKDFAEDCFMGRNHPRSPVLKLHQKGNKTVACGRPHPRSIGSQKPGNQELVPGFLASELNFLPRLHFTTSIEEIRMLA